MGLFSSAKKQSELDIELYPQNEASISLSVISRDLLGLEDSYALTINYLYYFDRVLFNLPNEKATAVITDFMDFILNSIEVISTVKKDSEWEIKKKKINFGFKNEAWRFLKGEGNDDPLFVSKATLFLDGQRIYCNTSFSHTPNVEEYAWKSLDAIASYILEEVPINDYSFFIAVFSEQLKYYNYKKPGMRELGNAVMHSLVLVNNLKSKS